MSETDPQTAARIPLAQAAKRLGVSRPTIYRWAKEGRFSVTQDDAGQKLVDMAELARVFPENASRLINQDAKRQPADNQSSPDVLLIQAALEATRDALRITQDQLAEAKEREHRLLGIVESQTRLLEHKPEAPAVRPEFVNWLAAAILVAGLLVAYALLR